MKRAVTAPAAAKTAVPRGGAPAMPEAKTEPAALEPVVEEEVCSRTRSRGG
jgi:hypothetical protein